ncbi:MAG TPA: SusC/RagA family TonB-linked outer membrane protein, partial [Bacteroidales bacterium]|nr:SusC/RagA family TonB-linked outer membrane protein [Bacteroidales bacterium]
MTKKAIWEYVFPKIFNTNFLLTMKISTVLAFCLSVQISAGVYSQDTKLKLQEKENTMAQVIDAIENQTDYKIFYRTDQFDTQMPVLLTSTDQTVSSVLKEAFNGSNYTYKLLEKIIVIAPADKPQKQTISGIVTDAATGDPIPGVNVVLEGTTIGTTTDVDGKYSISVEGADAVLLFSYVGYVSNKVSVQGRNVIDIQLTSDVKALEEVVVVGYGTMKKLDVSGSIVSANSKVISEVPSTSATAALQGRLPGIEMAQTSTRPGANMQIRIRGERSLNATNDPLVVVDGIPFSGTISDISTSDIKSIDILKDASATAIYGSRGANGVILITTFRGAVNAEPTISYNGYYGIKTVAKKYDVYNGEEFKQLRHDTQNTTYKDKFTSLEQGMIDAGKSTDWQDLMYDNARVTNHDLSISAGSNKGAYSLGAGYYNETAVLPGQEYSRFSVRTTVDQDFGKFVKIGLSSQNSYGITDGESASLMNNILTMSPLMPAYNDDGTVRMIPSEGS